MLSQINGCCIGLSLNQLSKLEHKRPQAGTQIMTGAHFDVQEVEGSTREKLDRGDWDHGCCIGLSPSQLSKTRGHWDVGEVEGPTREAAIHKWKYRFTLH